MYDRAYAIATGAFLLVALAALAFTAYWLAGADQGRRPYIVISPYSVAGLAVGSEVLYRGVPAGRVDRIGIDPDDPAAVRIRIAVDPEVPVLESTIARLQRRGLTGVAQVELEHRQPAAPLLTRADDPARIPLVPSVLEEATELGTRALEILSDVADALDAALNDDNRGKLAAVAGRVDNLLTSIEELAGTLESQLPPAIDSAERAADSVAELAERTTASMDDVDALIAELRATAEAAREVAVGLADGPGPDLDRAVEAVNGAAREIARLARSLAADPAQLWRGRQAPAGPGEE